MELAKDINKEDLNHVKNIEQNFFSLKVNDVEIL